MKKTLTFIAIILNISACDFKSSKEYLKEAWVLEDSQKYPGAIKLLNKAIDKEPSFIEAYLSRGADKSALTDYKGAIFDYSKALEIDPKNILALFNSGNNYKRLNLYSKAITYYSKALALKGNGYVYFDDIPNEFIASSNFDVPVKQIFYERALAYLNIDSLKLAFTDFHYCINAKYQLEKSYYWLGVISNTYNRRKQACDCFFKADSLGNESASRELKKYCQLSK